MPVLDTASWLSKLKDVAVEKGCSTGSAIQNQGSHDDYVRYILSGTISAVTFTEDGNEIWIAEYKTGQFIGLLNLFGFSNQAFEFKADTDCQLLVIKSETITALMAQHRDLAVAIAQELSRQLDMSMQDLLNVHVLSVRGRICIELLRRAVPIGVEPDQYIIRPNPVFNELARRLNTSRETVSRTVSELQGRGIIQRKPGAMLVLQPANLKIAYK